MAKHDCIGPLVRAGIDYDDAQTLRRIAMTLHRWHEKLSAGTNTAASSAKATMEPAARSGPRPMPLAGIGTAKAISRTARPAR